MRAHRQNEQGSSLQLEVGDRRNPDAELAILHLDRDGSLLQDHRKRLPQIGHHAPEASGQFVMTVLGIADRTALFAKGRQLACQAQALFIQALRMQQGQALQVSEQRLLAVDRLQQQEVSNFTDTRAARLNQAGSQSLTALKDHAVDFTQITVQHPMCRRMQQGRHIARV